MLNTTLVYFLPLICFSLINFKFTIELFWQTLSRRVSLNTNLVITSTLTNNILFYYTLLYFIYIIYINNYTNFIIFFQIIMAMIFLLSLIKLFLNKNYSNEFTLIFSISTIQILWLLTTTNLITLFFLLELTNSIILYTMLITSLNSQISTNNTTLQLINTLIYQFILNFFSSIVLYITINLYIVMTGTTYIINITELFYISDIQTIISWFLLAFLIKIGNGPWIFFKISIYRNMNYYLVAFYSFVYISIILVLFINLILLYNFLPLYFFKLILLFLIWIAVISFSTMAFQTSNIFVFLSFSSLINITIFILQTFICI